MPSREPPGSPLLEGAAVALILIALVALGWKATYVMGRGTGDDLDASWSFLFWTVVSLLLLALLLGRFLARRRGAGTGNRPAALVAIAVSLVVIVLMLASGP